MSWDRIDAWAKERYVDTATPGLLVHPTKGKYCCLRVEDLEYLRLRIRGGFSWGEVCGARRGMRYCLMGPPRAMYTQEVRPLLASV